MIDDWIEVNQATAMPFMPEPKPTKVEMAIGSASPAPDICETHVTEHPSTSNWRIPTADISPLSFLFCVQCDTRMAAPAMQRKSTGG